MGALRAFPMLCAFAPSREKSYYRHANDIHRILRVTAFPKTGAPPIVLSMSHSGFVPLRIFSSFTMLDGAIEPKAIAKRAQELGFPAAALTDRNGLYAAMAYSDAARGAGVQPIIGAMLGVCRPGMPDGVTPVLDWIALYAQDEIGYQNLCVLVSQAHLD
eukprot:gene32051-36812_t